MKSLTISTILHVKNSELYLREVIESWQGISDEIIVLNNGSTDQSINIAKSFDNVRVVEDSRRWIDVGEHVVRNDALKLCTGNFVAIPDTDEVLWEGQDDAIMAYLAEDDVGAWRFLKVEFYGDHYHIQDQYRGPHLDGVGEEVPGFGRQVIHGHPYIYRNHSALRYSENTAMMYGLHSSIRDSARPERIKDCLDIRVAHYGFCMSNESLYNKTIFYYNGVKDVDDICRTKEYQDQIDPNNPLGFHPDQAVRPFFGKPPIYMQNHSERFHRITTRIDDEGKARIATRSDTPIDIPITIGTPAQCGRSECNYEEPAIDVDIKKKANEFSVIKALDYYTATAELCMIHPNVFVMLNENIPHNPQFDDTVWNRITNIIHKNARHFIAVSSSVRNALLIDGVSPEKITTVNFWGCDTEFWSDLEFNASTIENKRNALGLVTDKLVMYAGRITEHKGISYLIDAVSGLECDLVICGEGDIAQFINKSRASSRNRLHYIGGLDRNRLLELYNICDILVLPSIPTTTWIEQFGRVLTEAMSCCKPCISTMAGGPLDIIDSGVTGLLVEPADSDQLATAISTILSDKNLALRMGLAGRRRVLDMFSNEVSSRKIDECIRTHMWN